MASLIKNTLNALNSIVVGATSIVEPTIKVATNTVDSAEVLSSTLVTGSKMLAEEVNSVAKINTLKNETDLEITTEFFGSNEYKTARKAQLLAELKEDMA